MESYSSTDLALGPSGKVWLATYRHLYDDPSSPLNRAVTPGYEALFFEPFYQLMRQQFLANEMEKTHEWGADIVNLLHIAPAHNLDFRRVTSPDLKIGDLSAIDIWKKQVKSPNRFISVSTEMLFGNFSLCYPKMMIEWKEYITNRYLWSSNTC
jgi:hypothetical protein